MIKGYLKVNMIEYVENRINFLVGYSWSDDCLKLPDIYPMSRDYLVWSLLGILFQLFKLLSLAKDH